MKYSAITIALPVLLMLVSEASYGQAPCNPPISSAELNINNVRTTVLAGGDMWWNLSNGKYEIPKGSGKNSIFNGALWIGGIDAGGQIRVATQTYRQTGNDFWAGPLDTTNATTNNDRCLKYDKHYTITRKEVEEFVKDPSKMTEAIRTWPGNGNQAANESRYLAPFIDKNGDGIYNPFEGDYPAFNLTNDYPKVTSYNKRTCDNNLMGDQNIWWVINDVGNAHTNSGSLPLGIEIRNQAFAFQTDDEINDATFYKYQLINRSSQTLSEMYFGNYVDVDLGNYIDDYVGCDVPRGLGFVYNGDEDDETNAGYGINPPALGVDFLQGPEADIADNIDNDQDGCVDCTFYKEIDGTVTIIPDNVLKERIKMSNFMYLGSDNTILGMPYSAVTYYYRMQSRWLNGSHITFGWDGNTPGSPPANYMFSWGTDPAFPGQMWTEELSGNTPSDRRFLLTAGTFTLQPGEVKNITMGVMWARAQQGGRLASLEALKVADDKAQALFDNCFKTIDGPMAPDLSIRELDKKVLLTIQNYHNEKTELFNVPDPLIAGVPDSLKYYKFQGYQIYQLRDAAVGQDELRDSDKARLVAQCDIKDGIGQLVNLTYDALLNGNMPVEMVNGSDNGIEHTFEIKQDLFATGSTSLINHKTYFYTIVAYAHNEYKKYIPTDPASLDGQKRPYLEGSENVKVYSAIPHHHAPENFGQTLNANWGSGVVIRRIEGKGNGGLILDMTADSENEVVTPPHYRSFYPKYKASKGPVEVKIFDPVALKSSEYELKLESNSPDSHYYVRSPENNSSVKSEYGISYPNPQVFPEWGFTTRMRTISEPGSLEDPSNGFIEATITFADESKRWLSGVGDNDISGYLDENWIRCGSDSLYDYLGFDNNEIYENLIGGTWAPYKLTAKSPAGPKWSGIAEAQISLSPNTVTKTGIQSVDLVITPDQSKWTRAAVVETGSDISQTIGNARQYDLRKSPSIGKNGEQDFSVSATGMSWFPGYAYNVETGERLNIAFGENSSLTDQNSTDLKFNPTSQKYANGTTVFGGMHYIYIFGHNNDGVDDVPMYDSCRFIAEKLNSGTTNSKRSVWKDAMWCSLPLIADGFDQSLLPNNIPTEVRVRIRVARNYAPYAAEPAIKNVSSLVPGQTYFVASTPVTHAGTTYNVVGQSFTASSGIFTGNGTVTVTAPKNNFLGLYEFSTRESAPAQNNPSVAKEALAMINVVPNPYYAWSAYENANGDSKIKLTNLPPNCKVTILTQNGVIVKRLIRDDKGDHSSGEAISDFIENTDTSLDWDLKNSSGQSVASGIYLIHIDAGSLGTRTLKWFGLMRPSDSAGF